MTSWVRHVLWLVLMMVAAPRVAGAELVWALTGDNRLVVFNATTPGVILRDVPITGLQPSESMRAIDFRPKDNQLYGYGSTHRIYRIHMLTGVATAISPMPLAITVSPSDNMGFDFDPRADQIRIITSSEQNFRVDPLNGLVLDGDSVTPGIQGDSPLTPVGNYVAAAYSDNYAGTTATTLFAINSAGDRLVVIGGFGGVPSPSLGAVTDLGPLGVATDQTAALDAPLFPGDELYAHVSSVGLCVLHPSAPPTILGPINTTGGIVDISVLSVAATVYALTDNNHILQFKNYAPETLRGDATITGLVNQATGERLVGIDVRPATGVLYGVSDQGRVYTLDLLNGTATPALTGFGPLIGKDFGVDFDPAIDELRVVSGAKMNRRWNPDTFKVTVGTDLLLAGVGGISSSGALTSQLGQSTLLGLTDKDVVVIGGPGGTPSPDGGSATKMSTHNLALGSRLGFDIGPVDDQALVGGRVGTGIDFLFHLSPTTGAIGRIGPIQNAQGPIISLAFASPGRLEFSTPTLTTSETALFVVVTVNRVGGLDGPLSVDLQVAGGTATPGVDFGLENNTLMFGDGQPSRTIILPITNDTEPEGTETFTLSLANPTPGARLGATTTLTVTIEDDEVPPNPPPTITITQPTTDPFVRAIGTVITLSGTASDNTSVTSVTWSTDHGHSGTAQGTTEWLAADIPLAYGTTLITVKATDSLGAESTDTLEVDIQNVRYLLAEGATGTFFDTDILLANPNAVPAPITLSFLKEGGGVQSQTMTLPATSRTTVRLDEIPGLESTAVSTSIESEAGLPLVVERTMRWDGTGYGAHTEKAVSDSSRFWYFAEGSQGFFYTYLLLVNPASRTNDAKVTFLREGMTPITRTYSLPAFARVTVDCGADPSLVNTSFGMIVDFGEVKGVAERAMYFGTSPLWKAGHESAGVTTPAREWFLAEGATGPFFETFVLLSNPQTTPADVTVKYLRAGAPPITKTKVVPASGRFTINVETEDPGLGNAAFGTQITSSVPIVVERAQYWPSTPDQWYEAHNSFGTLAAATKWGLAEGRVGGPNNYQTYILLANPSALTADVTIVFLRTNSTTVTKTFSVPAASRFNVAPGPGGPVPELVNEDFAAVITSTQPIVVERAMYLDAGGVTWSAGTNATATRLP